MTITRGFGLSINTQTGETTRWAAGDPASVAERLPDLAFEYPDLNHFEPAHRPAGSQCIQCEHSASDCSALDFAAMRPTGKRDPDGSQRVACSGYVRKDTQP